ncbi:MAG: hypothetical protein K0R55_4309 [Sporomusa sp.]|nr:hypothetical protein [Sporomusa sp.]
MLAYEKFSEIQQAVSAAIAFKTITLVNILKVAKQLEQFKIFANQVDSISRDIEAGVKNEEIIENFFGSNQHLQLVFSEKLCIGTYKKQRTIAILNLDVAGIIDGDIHLIPELKIDISDWRCETSSDCGTIEWREHEGKILFDNQIWDRAEVIEAGSDTVNHESATYLRVIFTVGNKQERIGIGQL